METERAGHGTESTRQSARNPLAKRAVLGVVGFVALFLGSFFAGSFSAGAVIGASTVQLEVFAYIAGAIFVAPFSYVLFDRLVTWGLES